MSTALAAAHQSGRPTLHLSGTRLRAALEGLIRASEQIGGIERFAEAVQLKAELFQERLGGARAEMIERARFDEIVRFMPTVRRRLPPLIEARGWPNVRAAIAALLRDAHVPRTADARIAAFEGAICAGECGQPHGSDPVMRPPRFVRDLAAELLHSVLPELHPLMTRWVWDAKANTGVLREIWHDPASDSEAADHLVLDVPDTHETFLVLREELSQFLSDQGLFRDMLWYVDLLCAQVYGGYINAQGGAWLKTDFSAEGDPLEHTRRILGLDVKKRVASKE
jgi:hypothetical protein